MLTTFQNVEKSEIDSALKTATNAPPKLVVLLNEQKILGAYIVGDEVVIKCYGECMMVFLLQLFGVYYIFDLDYPKCFSMFLGFFQQFAFGELYTLESSKKFNFFVKKFRPVFNRFAAMVHELNASFSDM